MIKIFRTSRVPVVELQKQSDFAPQNAQISLENVMNPLYNREMLLLLWSLLRDQISDNQSAVAPFCVKWQPFKTKTTAHVLCFSLN